MQGRPNFTMVDRRSNGLHPSPRSTEFTITDQRSSELQRNAEVGNSQKTKENRHKTCFTQENSRLRSRESSTDSYNNEQNHDKQLAVFDLFCFSNKWRREYLQLHVERKTVQCLQYTKKQCVQQKKTAATAIARRLRTDDLFEAWNYSARKNRFQLVCRNHMIFHCFMSKSVG